MFELFCLELEDTFPTSKKKWVKRGKFAKSYEAADFLMNSKFFWENAYLRDDKGYIYQVDSELGPEKFEDGYIIEYFFQDDPSFKE